MKWEASDWKQGCPTTTGYYLRINEFGFLSFHLFEIPSGEEKMQFTWLSRSLPLREDNSVCPNKADLDRYFWCGPLPSIPKELKITRS